MNPRKNKKLFNIWLTKEEERLLNEVERIPSVCWTILKKAKERGDFKKA